MSGLLALLDDVAGIAKMAAASVDDVATQAVKASSKAAGVVIDDAAVTPKYVTGLAPARELPMIWKITKGSIFNKIVILLPGLMLLATFLPWIITPLLMVGGLYLCFEGAEKVLHWIKPHASAHIEEDNVPDDPIHLEETRVRGAIKTDFILSAEIMTIILNGLPAAGVAFTAASLGLAGLTITAAVYGAVALIVKADDVGLHLANEGRSGVTRAAGAALVRGMPGFLRTLTVVGTLAMVWVGGSIVLHGLEVTHLWAWPYETIKALATAAAQGVEIGQGFVKWLVTAVLDGIIGLALGFAVIVCVNNLLGPLLRGLSGQR